MITSTSVNHSRITTKMAGRTKWAGFAGNSGQTRFSSTAISPSLGTCHQCSRSTLPKKTFTEPPSLLKRFLSRPTTTRVIKKNLLQLLPSPADTSDISGVLKRRENSR